MNQGKPIPYILEDLAEFFEIPIEEAQWKLDHAIEAIHASWAMHRLYNENLGTEHYYRNNIPYVFANAYSSSLEYVQQSRHIGLSGISGQKVLDFGCGIGVTTKLLKDLDNYVAGYDINSNAVEFAHFRATKHNYGLRFYDKLPDLDEFSVVVALDVLEHIEDLQSLLKKLGSEMRIGARLHHYDTFTDGSIDHFDHSENIDRWLDESGFEMIDKRWCFKRGNPQLDDKWAR